jgi:hypothetical protein
VGRHEGGLELGVVVSAVEVLVALLTALVLLGDQREEAVERLCA